jgi:hypothetical protein
MVCIRVRSLLAFILFAAALSAPVPSGTPEMTKVQNAATKVHQDITSGLRKAQRRLAAAMKGTMESPYQDTLRQLTESTSSQCVWQEGNCSFSQTASADMFTNLPANSVMKQTWDKCSPCMNKHSSGVCVAASKNCFWEKDGCGCNIDDDFTQKLMGKMMNGEGCGWIGRMMEATSKCAFETTAACASTSGCELGSTHELPENPVDGMQCILTQQCETGSSTMNEVMCPGLTETQMENLVGDCNPTPAPTLLLTITPPPTPSFDDRMNAIVACIKGKCSLYGDMMKAFLTDKCKSYEDNTNCTAIASDKCKWSDGSCGTDAMALMMKDVPDKCAFKSLFMDIQGCEATTQSTCESNAKCSWEQSESCAEMRSDYASATFVVESETSCGFASHFMFEAMAKGSCDPDMTILAEGMKTDFLCEKATSSATCTAVKKQTITKTVTEADCSPYDVSGAAGAVCGVVPMVILLYSWMW